MYTVTSRGREVNLPLRPKKKGKKLCCYLQDVDDIYNLQLYFLLQLRILQIVIIVGGSGSILSSFLITYKILYVGFLSKTDKFLENYTILG